MDELLNQLCIKTKELDAMIKYAQEYLLTAPEGSLHIKESHNTEQYYKRSDLCENAEKTKETYIRKKNMELIRGLAQKDYAQKLLKQASEQRKNIQQLVRLYEPEGIPSIYYSLPLNRQKVVKPYIMPIDQFVEQWMKKDYEGKGMNVEEDSQILTERGDIVRSKSEKIIADKLYKMNIPYHYEKPIKIIGYGTIYPDFTVLNTKTRQEYYWEHFGLMDQPGYCEKAIKKIESLQKSQIFIGERLILTLETSQHPINIRIMEGLINKYLI